MLYEILSDDFNTLLPFMAERNWFKASSFLIPSCSLICRARGPVELFLADVMNADIWLSRELVGGVLLQDSDK